VIATAERLASFGPPAWRTPAEVVGGEVRTLEEFFRAADPLVALLVAVSPSDEPHGFVYLQELQDYFTLERHGHIGILAVAEQYEGQGAGKALMQASEDWARNKGYEKLTLSVFEHNHRARAVYERCGFKPDTIKYLKVL
jgi:GNAT superfamily N-acetyltransferase